MFGFNKKQQKAFEAIMSGFNVCITGPGGVGKSYIVQQIRNEINDETIFVAPTGIAAVNISGATIHRTFGLSTSVHLKTPAVKEQVRQVLASPKLKRLVIDEISMVRADIFEAIDNILRKCRETNEPFGGLQVIVIGDFYQLEPIVAGTEKHPFFSKYKSAYCFDTKSWKEANFITVDLDESMRQSDQDFVKMLNRIRVSDKDVKSDIDFINNVGMNQNNIDDSWIMLAATNAVAAEYNESTYKNLGDIFEKHYIAEIDKATIKPVDGYLKLKLGTKVLIKANDRDGMYVNGDRGEIVDLMDTYVAVKLVDGRLVHVSKNVWEEKEYVVSEDGSFKLVTIGTFKQFPIKYGWAITIHAAQGLTLDGAILNTGRGCFSNGQLYVALSRIKQLEKFCLMQPIRYGELMTSKEVKHFYENQDKYVSKLNHYI